MKKVIVLTGAGMSADSGLGTFRDSGGLWEEHDIYDVATPEGFQRNPEMVLRFYNERRRKVHEAEPHAGHKALARLEEHFDVTIVTQNIDNLHERAGSTDVLHLHGEISKVRSVENPSLVYDIGGDPIDVGDTAEDGAQLRPHVVWFGEMVPNMEKASEVVPTADILLVVGTSLVVFPAAGLVDLVPDSIPRFVVDPSRPEISLDGWEHLEQRAETGTPELADRLIEEKT